MRSLSPLRLSRRGHVARLIVLAGLLLPRALPSLAAPAPPADPAPARITYDAPSSCPSRDAFVTAVRAELASGRITDTDEPARLFAIDVARAGDRYRGRLTTTELDGATSTREITDITCEGVVAALSLITSLTIAAPPPSPPAPPTTATPRPTPIATTTPTERPPDPSPLPTTRPRTPDRPSSPSVPLRFEIGAHGGVFSAVGPGATFGAIPFLGWSAPPRTGVSPSIRLAAIVAQSLPARIEGGEALFRWFTFRADACPVALASGPLAARPCVGVDLGALQGEGSRVRTPLETTRFWADVHLAARLQWAISGGFVLELDGGAMAPLQRYEFGFDQGWSYQGIPVFRLIHVVPPVGGFATLGFGIVLR